MTQPPTNPILEEIGETLDESLKPTLNERDSAAKFVQHLPNVYPPEKVAAQSKEQRAWELVGLHLRNSGRPHEGIAIFAALYTQMLRAQKKLDQWVHKGMPLVWMSDCYSMLGFPVHMLSGISC